MTQIKVNGLTVELIRSKRKTLGLELNRNGIKARAPLRMPEADVITFIMSKQAWINSHLSKISQQDIKPPLVINDGAQLQLRGQDYTLAIESGKRAKVRVHNGCIIVPVINSKTPLEHRVKNKLITWYKSVALQELQTRARYYAGIMNVPERRTDQIYVRDYKRRWGSCDSNGKLSFNWRILQAPSAVSDYVVVHELAHCHEFNHSKRFWAIVAEQMPNYKVHEDWLNANGYGLYRL